MDIEDKDIELKSEEIQEILSRPPHALIRWGITVFFMVISWLTRKTLCLPKDH